MNPKRKGKASLNLPHKIFYVCFNKFSDDSKFITCLKILLFFAFVSKYKVYKHFTINNITL